MSDVHPPRAAVRADNVLVTACSHGRIFLWLKDADGECFAAACFTGVVAVEVAEGLIKAAGLARQASAH
jgi:hypothetical protein